MSDRRDAEGTKEWDRFWYSGSVEDYLHYRNCRGKEEKPEDAAYRGKNDRKFSDERDRFS